MTDQPTFIDIMVTISEPGKDMVQIPMSFNTEVHDVNTAIDVAMRMVKLRVKTLEDSA